MTTFLNSLTFTQLPLCCKTAKKLVVLKWMIHADEWLSSVMTWITFAILADATSGFYSFWETQMVFSLPVSTRFAL